MTDSVRVLVWNVAGFLPELAGLPVVAHGKVRRARHHAVD